MLRLPSSKTYLWRYIKPHRIESFLNGELHFAPLISFDDRQEAITPRDAHIINFMKSHAGVPFDLKKPLNEQDKDSITGTMLMWQNIYLLEKKFLLTNEVTDRNEVSKILYHYIDNQKEILKKQTEIQLKYYASCWFASGLDESSLMWTSYSEPGGIAVRMKYSDFRANLKKYFKTIDLKTSGIKEIKYGLLNYINQDVDYVKWSELIKKGVPLPFFKQHHFKQEKEFRIVLEKEDGVAMKDFRYIYDFFSNFIEYDIILHPASGPEELEYIKSRVSPDKKTRVNLSNMSFNARITPERPAENLLGQSEFDF